MRKKPYSQICIPVPLSSQPVHVSSSKRMPPWPFESAILESPSPPKPAPSMPLTSFIIVPTLYATTADTGFWYSLRCFFLSNSLYIVITLPLYFPF